MHGSPASTSHMKRIKNYTFLLVVLFTGIANIHLYAQQQPNIIYIYADDLGYGELGIYGQQIIRTPHLDQMAREGIRFTQHYSSAPVCGPSRCMLMTGKHGGHSYIRGNYELGGFADDEEGGQMPLHEGTYTTAHMLKAKGYATGLVGKWGMGVVGTTGSPLKQGFDYYYGYLDQKQAHNYYPTHLWENDSLVKLRNNAFNVHSKLDPATTTSKDFEQFIGIDYAPELITQKAVAFIQKNRNKPFFLYLPYTLPHLALQAPHEQVMKYVGQFEDSPYFGEKGYSPAEYPRATYAAMISFLDQQVGIVMEQIKKLGLDNNTIVLFSSDNGATFSDVVDHRFFKSNGELRGYKMDLYEGGIRVPFIVRWPGKIKAGQVSDHLSVQYDLMPTLADLTGSKLQQTDGLSLLPTLLGKGKQQKHDFLYFEYPENNGWLSVRIGNWKGIKKKLKNGNIQWELYNLVEDSQERNNLANQYPEILKEMDIIVLREHQHPHVLDWEIVDPKVKKKN